MITWRRVLVDLVLRASVYGASAAMRPGDPPPPGWELVWPDGRPHYRQPIAGGWRYADVRDAWLRHLLAAPSGALGPAGPAADAGAGSVPGALPTFAETLAPQLRDRYGRL